MRCEKCAAVDGASEYIVTKPSGDVRRAFCEKCAASTAETYPVKPVRQPAKAEPKDETPPAATSISHGKRDKE